MSSAEWVRWGALGAFLAGLAWVVSGLISLAIPGQGTEVLGSSSYYLLETMFCIASVGMMGGLVGLHARQVPSYGALGATGFIYGLHRDRTYAHEHRGHHLSWARSSRLALRARIFRHVCRIGSLGRCDPAGGDVAAVVRGLAHRRRLRHPSLLCLGELWRCDVVRPLVAGTGLRALVAEGRIGGATFARELGKPTA